MHRLMKACRDWSKIDLEDEFSERWNNDLGIGVLGRYVISVRNWLSKKIWSDAFSSIIRKEQHEFQGLTLLTLVSIVVKARPLILVTIKDFKPLTKPPFICLLAIIPDSFYFWYFPSNCQKTKRISWSHNCVYGE